VVVVAIAGGLGDESDDRDEEDLLTAKFEKDSHSLNGGKSAPIKDGLSLTGVFSWTFSATSQWPKVGRCF